MQTRTFLFLAFAFSWTIGAAVALSGGLADPVRKVVGGFAFMLGPALAALLATRGLPWAARRSTLGLGVRINWWLLVAWLLPFAALVMATLGATLVPGTALRPPLEGIKLQLVGVAPPEKLAELASVPAFAFNVGLFAQALLAGPLINLPLMLSEELGWRGYLWSRWKSLGFWRRAGATGLVWGVWHAPMILMGHNYPDTRFLGIALMTVFCLLLAPLIQLVRERGGSVWHACLFHGTLNAGASLADLCLASPGWMGRGILGLPGFVVLGVMNAAVLLWMRREWRALGLRRGRE